MSGSLHFFYSVVLESLHTLEIIWQCKVTFISRALSKTLSLTLLFVSFNLSSKYVFLSKTAPCFYPCRFPSLIYPFDHLKHQSITTRSCALCLLLTVTRCLPSSKSSSPLSRCRLPNSGVCGRSEQVYVEGCLNVVQLVGSHTGCCTSNSLFVHPCNLHEHTKTWIWFKITCDLGLLMCQNSGWN